MYVGTSSILYACTTILLLVLTQEERPNLNFVFTSLNKKCYWLCLNSKRAYSTVKQGILCTLQKCGYSLQKNQGCPCWEIDEFNNVSSCTHLMWCHHVLIYLELEFFILVVFYVIMTFKVVQSDHEQLQEVSETGFTKSKFLCEDTIALNQRTWY